MKQFGEGGGGGVEGLVYLACQLLSTAGERAGCILWSFLLFCFRRSPCMLLTLSAFLYLDLIP